MKIAIVVTYVSADGAFGGPVAVAVNQAAELARRGHVVDLYAGWDGIVEFQVPGVRVRLFRARRLPGLGFAGRHSWAMRRTLHKDLPDYEIVHIHLARDLITLPAGLLARKSRIRYFAQPHGMIVKDARLSVRFIDALFTKRVLRGAESVLTLTDDEAASITMVAGPNIAATHIDNGAPPFQLPAVGRLRASPPEILFLARLHPRKRVLAFAEMAKQLFLSDVEAKFTVIGPDEGDLPALRGFIARNGLAEVLQYSGTVEPGVAVTRLARATAFVLPSEGEVFPMTVLEALQAGTPVVTTESNGLATLLRSHNAAVVTDGSPGELARAVREILGSVDRQNELIDNAHKLLRSKLGISAVVDELEQWYRHGEVDG